ncbi:ap-3 complex subunit mu-1 [Anaeramoeba flamelloides]|uniref:Ap-3 complex subunit mu-1 n=1 Tax=Anaeramoeba flamelloides TaxID=1746091 RepID=A0ABQ8Z6S7_9EUKA|nr:ap-3 complex subunit mu-1 [Anaeramoeba flamelloides]
MIESLFILDLCGNIIFQKHWSSRISERIVTSFWINYSTEECKRDISPILKIKNKSVVHILNENLIYLVTISGDNTPLLIIEFLYRSIQILQNYFKKRVDEELIKRNSTKIFELFGEMNDQTFVITTELSLLNEMIESTDKIEINPKTIKTAGFGKEENEIGLAWRKNNIKYSSNEIFFDLVESLNGTLTRNGIFEKYEVIGKMMCECKLSGMPDLLLQFKNPKIIEDVSFHRCIKIKQWEQNKVLLFVPPDGRNELLSYRSRKMQAQIPIFVTGKFKWERQERKGNFFIKIEKRSPLIETVENISVLFLLTTLAENPKVKTTQGTVFFNDITKQLKWEIGKLSKNKEVTMKGTIGIKRGSDVPNEKPVAIITFKAERLSLSGLQLSNLEIRNINYKTFKGVKFIAKSGYFNMKL